MINHKYKHQKQMLETILLLIQIIVYLLAAYCLFFVVIWIFPWFRSLNWSFKEYTEEDLEDEKNRSDMKRYKSVLSMIAMAVSTIIKYYFNLDLSSYVDDCEQWMDDNETKVLSVGRHFSRKEQKSSLNILVTQFVMLLVEKIFVAKLEQSLSFYMASAASSEATHKCNQDMSCPENQYATAESEVTSVPRKRKTFAGPDREDDDTEDLISMFRAPGLDEEIKVNLDVDNEISRVAFDPSLICTQDKTGDENQVPVNQTMNIFDQFVNNISSEKLPIPEHWSIHDTPLSKQRDKIPTREERKQALLEAMNMFDQFADNIDPEKLPIPEHWSIHDTPLSNQQDKIPTREERKQAFLDAMKNMQ
jgi:hypothetical protein